MEGTERHPPGKESAGRWPQGRKYCSTASHAARNGVQAIKGLSFSLFGTPQHLHRVFRVKRNLGFNLFSSVTAEYCKLGKFCSVMMDQRETRFSLSIKV